MMLLWNYRLPLVARWRSQMQELWRTNQLPPGYNVPQFHAILHRFDLIAGQLARVPASSCEVGFRR
jgi:hypothetical protein